MFIATGRMFLSFFVSEACFCEQPIVPVMGHD